MSLADRETACANASGRILGHHWLGQVLSLRVAIRLLVARVLSMDDVAMLLAHRRLGHGLDGLLLISKNKNKKQSKTGKNTE